MASKFPPVRKIFEDLEKFKEFCTTPPGRPFDEADLYREESPVWKEYKKHLAVQRTKARNKR